MLKQIIFTSKKDIESSPGASNIAVISITNNDDKPANISKRFGPCLRLMFDDIDESKIGQTLFTIEKADKIWDFTESLQNNIDILWVHCTFGVSRSAAVAKAIAEQYNLPYPDKYSIYNKRVYRVLRQSMQHRIYPDIDGLYI